jgi:hypothetical protein
MKRGKTTETSTQICLVKAGGFPSEHVLVWKVPAATAKTVKTAETMLQPWVDIPRKDVLANVLPRIHGRNSTAPRKVTRIA